MGAEVNKKILLSKITSIVYKFAAQSFTTGGNMKQFLIGMAFVLCATTIHADCPQWCDPCYKERFETDSGFFGGAELLYWTVCQSDMDYAVDVNDVQQIQGPGVGPGHRHFLDYEWDFGGRAIVGYRFCEGWDVRGIYTYYQNRGSGNTTNMNMNDGRETHLKPTLWHPKFGEDRAEKARASNRITYQTLDVLTSRPFCPSDCIGMRPFFGVRLVWLDQDEHVKYSGKRDFTPSKGPGKIKWDADTSGIGLHAGLDTHIYVCDGLSVYGSFAGSLISGWTRSKEFQIHEDVTSVLPVVDLKESQCNALPGYNIGTGLCWKRDYCNTLLSFTLGYEFTHWFNTPTIRRYMSDRSEAQSTGLLEGETMFHGFTLNCSVLF